MEYIKLNNGINMPILGYGTWDVRGSKGKEAIINALNIGYRLIDTAQMYDNEEIVGQAIKESHINRDEIFVTTKLYRISTSYQKAKEDINKSLTNLNTNYIDLLLVHEPYNNSLEIYKALIDAYKEGKVRAIGISNFDIKRYKDFISQVEIIPAINQVESHVYYPQFGLKDFMEQFGTKMQSWGSFTEGRKDIFNESILLDIANKHHKTSAQVALRYLIQNEIAVIPKSANVDRMSQNFDIFDFSLDQDDLNKIKTLNTNKSLFNWY